MSVAWHSRRWWDWCMLEDEKKELDPIFNDKVGKPQKLAEEVRMFLVQIAST